MIGDSLIAQKTMRALRCVSPGKLSPARHCPAAPHECPSFHPE
jgi:hypothetical protein